jgi:hypothetical protein
MVRRCFPANVLKDVFTSRMAKSKFFWAVSYNSTDINITCSCGFESRLGRFIFGSFLASPLRLKSRSGFYSYVRFRTGDVLGEAGVGTA